MHSWRCSIKNEHFQCVIKAYHICSLARWCSDSVGWTPVDDMQLQHLCWTNSHHRWHSKHHRDRSQPFLRGFHHPWLNLELHLLVATLLECLNLCLCHCLVVYPLLGNFLHNYHGSSNYAICLPNLGDNFFNMACIYYSMPICSIPYK